MLCLTELAVLFLEHLSVWLLNVVLSVGKNKAGQVPARSPWERLDSTT